MLQFKNNNYFTMREKQILVYYLYDKINVKSSELEHLFTLASSTVHNYYYSGRELYRNLNKDKRNKLIKFVEENLIQIEEDIKKEVPKVTKIIVEEDFIEYDGILVNRNCDSSTFNNVCTTYINEVYKDDKLLFLKVGKSGHLIDRMKAHKRNKKYNGNKVKLYKVYTFDNPEDSLTMENYMRKYYKNKYSKNYLKLDRFINVPFDKKDEEYFDKVYKKILSFDKELI